MAVAVLAKRKRITVPIRLMNPGEETIALYAGENSAVCVGLDVLERNEEWGKHI